MHFQRSVGIMDAKSWIRKIGYQAPRIHNGNLIKLRRPYSSWALEQTCCNLVVLSHGERHQVAFNRARSFELTPGNALFRPSTISIATVRGGACAPLTRRAYSSGSAASAVDHEDGDDSGLNRLLSGSLDARQITQTTSSVYSGQTQQTVTTDTVTRQRVTTNQISPMPTRYWSHHLHKTPDGNPVIIHYCRSLRTAEDVAQYFLDDEVIGFDMEWKAQATYADGIKDNLSIIQIANEKRVALFHIACFRGTDPEHYVAPLRRIMESPNITKVGVSIKADCTRLRKFLGINARGIFELSHLHKLVKYSQSQPKLVNKRLVNLNDQVEEHFGLPLLKESEVRCSDWTRPLNYDQVQYAANDPYACICLFKAMDGKRQAMVPAPPRPAHAELDLPIRLVEEATKATVDEERAAAELGGTTNPNIDGKAV